MHISPSQLNRIQELLADRPQCHLAIGVTGICTCDGMAIEYPGGVIHPLSFLELMDGPELEPLDILKEK
jgi:hypothetical protein